MSKQNVALARLLLDPPYGASARTRDRRQQLPLHRAAAVGSSPLINMLLDHRSPIDVTDADGSTPLHHAIAEGHGDAATTLLRRGADSGVKDRDGRLAIECAPDSKVVKFVLAWAEAEGVELVRPEKK